MWIYQGKPFSDDQIEDNYGFVYIITNLLTGQAYIGRKYFFSKRTLPPLKGKTRKRHIKTQSNWKDYWGSCKPLLNDIEAVGKHTFSREIISLHKDKRETNYAELAEQVMRNVLDAIDNYGNRLYYNENILSRYYPSVKYGSTRRVEHQKRLSVSSNTSPTA